MGAPTFGALGGGNMGAPSPKTAANKAGGPDVTWIYWGEKLQASGMTAIAGIAGYPDVGTYSASGHSNTLDRNRGVPWVGYGAQFSVTKPTGGCIAGNLSYGAQKNLWFPGLIANSNIGQAMIQQTPIPFQEGEVLTGYASNTNTNEEQVMGVMVGYGGFPHPYPETIDECLRYGGIKPRQMWNVDCTFTVASACASGSGAAALDSVSQADLWLDADSNYYIVGAFPNPGNSTVLNHGFLQVKGNLGEYWSMRNAAIPFIAGPGAEPLSNNPGWTCPYRPIGPFRGDALPSVGGLGDVAGVMSFVLCLVKV